MNTFYCIGKEKASQVCRNKQCKQRNPFVCENPRACYCNVHNHNSQYKLISVTKFLQSVASLEIKQLCDSHIRLKQVIAKMQTQFHESITEFNQQINQIIEESKFAHSFLQPNLYQSIYVKKESYQQLDGRKVSLIRKASKNQSRSQIQNTLIQQISGLISSTKDLFQVFSNSIRKNLQDLRGTMKNFNKSSLQESSKIIVDQDIAYLDKLIHDKKIELVEDKKFKLDKLISNHFQQLTVIKIENCELKTEAFKVFQKYFNPNLKILALIQLKIEDEAISSIIKAKLPNLIQFKAFINHITDKGCQTLSLANWPNIGYFNLHSNKINSQGAISIINKYSNRLWRLDLDYNSINDQCYECIRKNKWGNITEIHLTGNNFSSSTLNSLEVFFRGIIKKPEKIFITHF